MIVVLLYISRCKVYSGSMMVSGFALAVGKPQAKVLWNLPRYKDLASTCRTVAVLYLTVLMYSPPLAVHLSFSQFISRSLSQYHKTVFLLTSLHASFQDGEASFCRTPAIEGGTRNSTLCSSHPFP